MLKALFLASLYGSCMGLVAYGCSFLIGRLRVYRGAAMLLWALVALRLLCPVGLTSAFSLFNAPQWAEQAAEQAETRQEPQREEIAPTEIQQPVQKPGTATNIESMTKEEIYEELDIVEPGYLAEILPQIIENNTAGNAGAVLVLIWAGGVAVIALWGIFSYVRFKRSLRLSSWLDLGLYEADSVTTACVVGIFHPRIYLPTGLTEQQKYHTVTHEKCHIRRGDHIWKILSYGVLAVHWFNPLVWLFYRRFQQDMELACDEKALKILGEGERAAYSQSLLDLSQKERCVTPGPVGFSENPTKNRILRALRYKRPLAVVTALVLVVGILLVSGVAAQPTEEEGLRLNEDGTVTVYLPTARVEVDMAGDPIRRLDEAGKAAYIVDILLYNTDGRPARYDLCDMDTGVVVDEGKRYTYDEQGRLIEVSVPKGLDSFEQRISYHYNSKGRLSAVWYYAFQKRWDGTGWTEGHEELVDREEYTYDEQGKLLRYDSPSIWATNDLYGNLVEYTYREEDRCVEAQHYRTGGNGQKEKFYCTQMYYDQEGKLLSINMQLADDLVLSKMEYTYNENGGVASAVMNYSPTEKEINSEGTEYLYDEHGNVIKKLYYVNGKHRYSYEYHISPVNVTPEAALRLLHDRPADPFELDPTPDPVYSNPFGGTNP